MSGYDIPARPVSEDGYRFDSVLERDWAGFITHTGLRWRQEAFAVLDQPGRVIAKNIVARPDFFLPDVAVIFECKPTVAHEKAGRDRWRREAAITGLPVLVSSSRPQMQWVTLGSSGCRGRMPPLLRLYRESGPALQACFAQCPDCDVRGLVVLSDSLKGWLDYFIASDDAILEGLWGRAPSEPIVDLWLSACPHRPRWSLTGLVDSMAAVYPGVGDVEAVR